MTTHTLETCGWSGPNTFTAEPLGSCLHQCWHWHGGTPEPGWSLVYVLPLSTGQAQPFIFVLSLVWVWPPGACWAVLPWHFPPPVGHSSLTQKGKNQPDLLCTAPHVSKDEMRVKMHVGDTVINTAYTFPHMFGIGPNVPCVFCVVLYWTLLLFVLSSFMFFVFLFLSDFGRSERLVCDAALCSWFS